MDRVTGTLPSVELGREEALRRMCARLMDFHPDSKLDVESRPRKLRRTDSQNRLLYALYADIVRLGGEAMQGYTKDELHDFFLGNHFGWEVKEIFGRKKQVPLQRSSRLTKHEFADFVNSVVIFMAERGVVLSLPGDL